MRPQTALLLGLLFIATILFAFSAKTGGGYYGFSYDIMKSNDNSRLPKLPSYLGEKIVYDVNFGGIRIGESTFNYEADITLNGRKLNQIIFQTRVPQFSDTEKIYSDPKTFLPVRIERNISKLFLKENITEDYDQSSYTVTIKKSTTLKRKNRPEIFKSDREIFNPILIPYYIRSLPDLIIGKEFEINLPRRRISLKLVSVESIDVPAGTFKAYHFQSDPKQIEFWIKADQSRIPVKIVGIGAYGYNMEMKAYTRN